MKEQNVRAEVRLVYGGNVIRAAGEDVQMADGLLAEWKTKALGEGQEWWIELENRGSRDSQVIEDVCFCDMHMAHEGWWKYPLLHTARGSAAQADDFEPLVYSFCTETRHVIEAKCGRTSSVIWPYFNMQLGERCGMILAIGWSGRWKAEALREKDVHFQVWLPGVHMVLKPGERMELPHMLAMPWQGDVEDSFNIFRRLMRDEILPKTRDGHLRGHIFLRGWGGDPAEWHLARLRDDLGAEMYQIDAGWHGMGNEETGNRCLDSWWLNVGRWKEIPALYPRGMEEVARAAREKGMGFSLWFEPERGVQRTEEYAEDYVILPGVNAAMRHLGREKARKRLLDELSAMIEKTQMDVLRIDFNYLPAVYWDADDTPERRGVSEITYINGLYTLLGELRNRFPGLEIDNCAGGGRRLDYRMFRHGMPMVCRSDFFTLKDYAPEGIQGQLWGLGRWLPVHGDCVGSCTGNTPMNMDTYRFRSSLGSGVGMRIPEADISQEEVAWYQARIREMKRARRCMDGDFYPLTGYSLSLRDNMAVQMHAGKEGFVAAFRRAESDVDGGRFRLRALTEGKIYILEDADTGDMGEYSAKALAEGLRVELPERRMARLIFYREKET